MTKKPPPLGLSLALISGKGGSGKTVIGLAMAKMLSEAGFSVLLVDCDTSTHGATYFFETELEKHTRALTLTALMRPEPVRKEVYRSRDGFAFIPSTLSPTDDMEFAGHVPDGNALQSRLNELAANYDITIYDCQAGYNPIVNHVCRASRRHLIVMEPDAVSSAAVRVLHLQIGHVLKASSTWQVFNKLTEEERPVYSKVMAGTLFTNLPAVPFDWSVRAAFAIKEIPTVMSAESVFGLALLRLAHIILPECREAIAKLEEATVGDWHRVISRKLTALEEERKKESRRFSPIKGTLMVMFMGLTVGFGYVLVRWLGYEVAPMISLQSLIKFIEPAAALAGGILAFFLFTTLTKNIRLKLEGSSSGRVDEEAKRYRTLLATDPRLREYERLHPEATRPSQSTDQ